EHIADLALPDADVARRDVRIFAEMAVKLSHERLAEPHDLHFGAPLGIEIGPALGAADGHACQSVLERLLEAEELDDPQIDAGVEPEAALVGAERRVEAHPEAAVDLHLTSVVEPRNAENNLALRLADPLDQCLIGVFGALGDHEADAFEHLPHSLVELDLAGIAPQNIGEDRP